MAIIFSSRVRSPAGKQINKQKHMWVDSFLLYNDEGLAAAAAAAAQGLAALPMTTRELQVDKKANRRVEIRRLENIGI